MKKKVLFLFFIITFYCFGKETLFIATVSNSLSVKPAEKDIIQEIFKNKKLKIEFMPLERSTRGIVTGAVDGIFARSYLFGERNKGKVLRVEESIANLKYNIYSKSEINVTNEDDLKKLRIIYVRGSDVVMEYLNNIKAENVFPISTDDIGFRLLEKERADIMISLDYYFNEYLKNEKQSEIKKIKNEIIVENAYVYLSIENKDILNEVAENIKKLKKESKLLKVSR